MKHRLQYALNTFMIIHVYMKWYVSKETDRETSSSWQPQISPLFYWSRSWVRVQRPALQSDMRDGINTGLSGRRPLTGRRVGKEGRESANSDARWQQHYEQITSSTPSAAT